MKLYHVCLPEESEGDLFYPRVPENRAVGEVSGNPRICLSDNISGCVSAVPWGGLQFDEMMINIPHSTESYPIKVYEFDSEDIEEGNLIHPSTLYKESLVPDAEINQEYWVINQNLKPRNSYFITITEFIEESEDDISYEDRLEMDRLDSLNESYDCEDYINGCFSKIIVDEYRVLNQNEVIIDDTFVIPISLLKPNDLDEDELKEIIETACNDLLVRENCVESVIIEDKEITIYTYNVCSLVLNNLIKNINNEI